MFLDRSLVRDSAHDPAAEHRFLTPREIEGRVRRPEEPLEVLTGLFMDARYGPDEPGDESVHRAEVASRTVIESLGRRRRPGRAISRPS
jgi:hypothetical protein